MNQLQGKVAVITGGSRGIGRAIVERFLTEGAFVFVGYYNDDDGSAALRDDFRDAIVAGKLNLQEGDISIPQTADEWMEQVVGTYGHLDVWVNNAAIQKLSRSETLSPDEWHRLLAVNLDGYFWGCQAAGRLFLRQRHGVIVNITSGNDVLAVKNLAAYTAAKGAIVALTKTLAVEWGNAGVRVNAVAPGATDTPLNADLYTDDVRALYAERIPLGRIALPHDIAAVVLFLASDDSRYVTGHELVVDGGLTINGTVYHPLDDGDC